MLYSTLMLMMSSAFLMLRLTPGGSFPRPLSEAEERKYLDAWLQGDLEARNVLIERNLRLVAHIIKKYYTHYDDTDDLISIGTIGLIKAVETFCPEKKIKLATYASRCIENDGFIGVTSGYKHLHTGLWLQVDAANLMGRTVRTDIDNTDLITFGAVFSIDISYS